MDNLIFHQSPNIRFGGNTFINVPIILQYEDTPLLEVVNVVTSPTRPDPVENALSCYQLKMNSCASSGSSKFFHGVI